LPILATCGNPITGESPRTITGLPSKAPSSPIVPWIVITRSAASMKRRVSANGATISTPGNERIRSYCSRT